MTTKAELKLKCDEVGSGLTDLRALIDGLPADPSPFSDQFNRTNQGLDDDGNWTRVGGQDDWGVIASSVLKTNNADNNGAVYRCPDLLSKSQFVSAVFLSNLNYSFIAARLTDPGNFIGMRWYNGNIELVKRVAGVAFTVFHSFATTRGASVFRMEYSEPAGTVRVLKDGVQIISPKPVGTITGLPVSTRAGVVLRGVVMPFIDNFTAGPLA